jgi:hypothetical protein
VNTFSRGRATALVLIALLAVAAGSVANAGAVQVANINGAVGPYGNKQTNTKWYTTNQNTSTNTTCTDGQCNVSAQFISCAGIARNSGVEWYSATITADGWSVWSRGTNEEGYNNTINVQAWANDTTTDSCG